MLTACFSMLLYLLFLLIRIVMKLRLSIPLVYLGCVMLSWIISLVRFVRRALA